MRGQLGCMARHLAFLFGQFMSGSGSVVGKAGVGAGVGAGRGREIAETTVVRRTALATTCASSVSQDGSTPFVGRGATSPR